MTISVLILGLGSSGAASARYCAQRADRFGPVAAFDAAKDGRVRAVADELEALGVDVRLGTEDIDGVYDLCIASPGIPPHAPLMQAASNAAGEVISEIEFAFRESSNAWVAVTGTNGKTTTTALVEHLLTVGGISARAVGNIGSPAIDAVAENDPGLVLVAEVSSFQLALTKRFHPRVAILLNVTPDHIDWHGSMERYAEDKGKVFANLGPDDTAVIDVDDGGSRSFVARLSGSGTKVVRVSVGERDADARRVGDTLVVEGNSRPNELIEASDLLIKGAHNVSNALAASAAALAMGVPANEIARGLRTFQPIEHRLEPAGVACGAEWFNDSKATNPDAVSKAIAAFPDRDLVLLLGGRNKGNDFRPLATQAARAARAVIAFGEARCELLEAFSGLDVRVEEALTMADAVKRAASIAREGDAVVLSPACASFDEFSNYEQRGRRFKALVAELGGCGS